MRCLPILFIFIIVHVVQAAIDDENNPNEIPQKDPSEVIKGDYKNNNSTHPCEDFDEVLIFSEEEEYEEIEFTSISKYFRFSKEIRSHDASNSQNKKGSPLKSSPDKAKVRKKRETCPNTDQQTFNCDPNYKYRTIDGTCNNLKNPEWGMGMGCQERLLNANYVGMAGFRQSVTGGHLPAPRNLSLHIFKNVSHPEKYRNHLSMFFGQFFAHDMVLTPLYAQDTGVILPCCEPDLRTDPRCANVYTTKKDPFYGPLNHLCLNNPRAVACNSCDNKGRLMLNMNTAFLDGSLVYGSSENTSMSLRANDGTGKLISQNTSSGELLPNSSNPQFDQCSFPNKDLICFEAGDARVNQHIIITCLQTIFMREHNRIASILKGYNPSWDEETLFQETRRITGALIEVILFKEYLPIVLNHERMAYYKLDLSPDYTTYNDSLNPSIWVEFSTAAFRVPHSSINSEVATKPRPVTEGKKLLRDLYSLPFGLRKEGFGPLIEDTTITISQKVDRYAVHDANDYLYRIPGTPGGLDLSAIDIQRGRDTGLPTYVQIVKLCHGVELEDFNGLLRYMSRSNKEVLESNYKSVDDIDLETALMLEKKERGSVFGPTSACIVTFQFYHLKFGDRFYFEHGNQSGSFTKEQIKELKKTSLTQIICKNVDGITSLPKNAMLFSNKFRNPRVKCKYVKEPDYSKWKAPSNESIASSGDSETS